ARARRRERGEVVAPAAVRPGGSGHGRSTQTADASVHPPSRNAPSRTTPSKEPPTARATRAPLPPDQVIARAVRRLQLAAGPADRQLAGGTMAVGGGARHG